MSGDHIGIKGWQVFFRFALRGILVGAIPCCRFESWAWGPLLLLGASQGSQLPARGATKIRRL
jgi:hypothetical protein